MSHDELDEHRYERLDEEELRDSLAKAKAQDERLQQEGSPEQIAEDEERKRDLEIKLEQLLEERRAGTPAEGVR